jgi:hypothetical protein
MVDDTNGLQITRRHFWSGLAAVFVSVLGDRGRILKVDAAEAGSLAADMSQLSVSSTESMELVKELLGKGANKVFAAKAKANLKYGDAPTKESPSSRHVREVVAKYLGLIGDNIEPVPDLMTSPDGLLMSFGGPFNNLCTRAILGTGSGSPLLNLLGTQAGILPVTFGIEKPAPENVPARVLFYGSDQKNFSDDCLIILSMPNPFSSSSGPGDRIQIIAARHRAGMMAIDRVVTNNRLLEQLVKETQGSEAWEILIPVRTIDRATPAELGQARVFPIRADFNKLRARVREEALLRPPYVSEQDAFLLSALIGTPHEQLDRKSSSRGMIETESSPSANTETRSAALRRSGEEVRTAATPHEETMPRTSNRADRKQGNVQDKTFEEQIRNLDRYIEKNGRELTPEEEEDLHFSLRWGK